MELISFIFYKIIVAAILLIMWVWPPIVALIIWVIADEESSSVIWERFWKGSVIVMGLLGTLTYWNAMVPGPLPVEHGRPADSAYYFVFHRSYKEYVTGKEAEKPPTRTELGTELRRYRLDVGTHPSISTSTSPT